MDTHLHRPVWSGEVLGLLTGHGTLAALRTGERGERGREKEGGEEVEIFNK